MEGQGKHTSTLFVTSECSPYREELDTCLSGWQAFECFKRLQLRFIKGSLIGSAGMFCSSGGFCDPRGKNLTLRISPDWRVKKSCEIDL
jgi:hypothetical protein